MLVLSRRRNESIVLPELGITIVIVEIRGEKARIGIEAPKEISVHRSEVWNAIQRSGNAGGDDHLGAVAEPKEPGIHE